MIKSLWTSYCAEQKEVFDFGKNVPPTVANGYVYLATFSGTIRVYGLRSRSETPQGSDTNPDCHVSVVMNSAGYPEFIEPKGVGYKQTRQASGGHAR